ncbi:MAG TPA: cyclic nucleotide-binding domain-containing protein [Acidimicrobiales bacterium]|nr:cyclic nucleotide-binding domain-containing protein [Acidimicrobiales bacterium]
MPRDVPREVLDVLQAVPLFSGCSAKELRTIAGLGTDLSVKEGTVLTEEGAPGSELVIVLAGEASCSIKGQEVAVFERGDFFGEMSLLDSGPRSATVVAKTDMDVLILEGREFKRLVIESPAIAWKMLVAMAGRLRRADELMRF